MVEVERGTILATCATLVVCGFLLYPLSRSIVLSLYKSAGPRQMQFVGLKNYWFLLHDKVFGAAVLNTTGAGDAIILRPVAPLGANERYTFVVTNGPATTRCCGRAPTC